MGNQPSSVPFGSSINLVNATLKCTATDLSRSNPDPPYQINLPFSISATAPLQVGYRQTYYYGDLKVAIGVPHNIQDNQREYGTYYGANFTTTLDVANLYGYNGTSFNISANMLRKWYGPYEVNIPDDPTQVLPLQPPGGLTPIKYKVGSDIETDATGIDLKVKNVTLILQNLRGDLAPLGQRLLVTCADQGFQYVVASTTAISQNSAVLAPANGYQASFPPTASNRKSSIANIPVGYYVNGRSRPDLAYNFTFGGQGPASLAKGGDLNLTNFNTFFTIPPALIKNLSSSDPAYAGKQYRLQFDSSSIGVSWLGVQGVPAANANQWNDDKDALPLSTARNVDYSFQGQETFALPLVGSLSKIYQSRTDVPYFELSSNGISGILRDFAPPPGVTADYDTYVISVGYNSLLKAPLY